MLRLETLRVPFGARAVDGLRFLPRLSESSFIVWPAIALYLTVGVILIYQNHLIVSDAWSRVVSAYAVLYSRDPHLAAIGFVWSPLPALVLIPLMPLHGLWPGIVAEGFAATIVSAFAMGAAVWQFHGMLTDWRLSRPMRLIATGLFALHPMTVLYGANGNTEALFLLFLVIATRYLARWLERPTVGPLAITGMALGCAYLTRYEAAAAGGLVAVSVMAITYARTPGDAAIRRITAAADGLIVGLPFAAAFVLWAAASMLITGSPFEQFTSSYGVAAQVIAGLGVFDIPFTDMQLMLHQLLGFQPLAIAIVVTTLAVAVWRRDLRWVAPAAVFGAIVVFVVWAWLTGRTAGWVRYYIAVIPLGLMLATLLVSPRRNVGRLRPSLMAAAGVGFVVVVGLTSMVSTVRTLAHPLAGRSDLYVSGRYELAVETTTFIDALGAEDGEVLIDLYAGSPIVALSENPRQFVMTSDRDFLDVVDDPASHGVKFLVMPPDDGLTSLDALNRTYPGIYRDGAGVASLVAEFDSPYGETNWRVYEVNQ